MEEAKRFLEWLHGKRVHGDVDDMVLWTETKSGNFLVKSLYLVLEEGCPSLFPSSYIWNVWVQPKISLFAWEAMWSKALTLDLIQKREWALATRCFMCLEKEEIIDHLFLHCTKTRVLWDLPFNLFGVSWVLPSSIRETLLSWHGSFVGKKRKKACRAAPLFIFWTVSKARNKLAFNDDMLSIQRLKYSFVLSLWSEAKLFTVDYPLTIVNFIDWLGSN